MTRDISFHLERLWRYLTTPHAAAIDDARREHMTRVILVMMLMVVIVASIPIGIGYTRGDFDLSTPAIMGGFALLIGMGWGLTQAGLWRWGAAIPPAIFVLFGWYIIYSSGASTSCNLAYGIALVLAAMLYGVWIQWLVLVICLLLDVSVLTRVYSFSLAELGPEIIPLASMLTGLALLQSFATRYLENALKQAGEAAIETRSANERLQFEAVERQKLITELKAKNTELEQFTYTVSHDLRSPLVTIRGFLGFLEKDMAAGNEERIKNDIQRIVAATDKMQQLLEELLELSRIGRITNPMQELPFTKIVQEALELIHGRIEAGHVRVSLAADMPTVYGDHIRLVQAMQNLLDNAAKFMGSQIDPQIEIGVATTRPVGSPSFTLRDTIFYVRDNGIGIAPEHYERIFGLFNKLEPLGEGTGIGLALVKRIIIVHGGQVWVESQGSGTGATFYFTLPLQPPHLPERP